MLDTQAAVAHHLRHRLRSARDRGVRGQRGRLPAEAGRSGAARAGACSGRGGGSRPIDRVDAGDGRRRRSATTSSRRSSSSSPSARAGASGWRSRSASGSCSCRPRKSSTRRWPTKASRSSRASTRHVELPDARRAADAARPERLLARASIAPGEHQQDQGDRPLVQPELHPEDEGREGDGDPGEPHADAAAAGVPEAVDADASRQPQSTTSSAAAGRSRRCGRVGVRRRRREPAPAPSTPPAPTRIDARRRAGIRARRRCRKSSSPG